MASFNVVLFPEFEVGAIESQSKQMELLRSMMSTDCALFLGVKGDETLQAFDFAREVLGEFEAPYVAFVWNQMTTKNTPRVQHQLPHLKTSLVFVWCFVRKTDKDEDIILNKNAGHHLIDSRVSQPYELFDAVADHLIFERRLAINAKKATTEFAVWNTQMQDDNVNIKPMGQLSVSSSRKTRLLRAYLTKVSRKQLLKDKTNLMNFFQERPHDENSAVLAMIQDKTQKEKEIMGLVRYFLKKKKREEDIINSSNDNDNDNNNTNKQQKNAKGTPSKKRKLQPGVGINKPVLISPEFEAFLKDKAKMSIKDNMVSRVDVVRAISKYIKDKKLNEGRVVMARDDAGLSALLQKDTPPEIDITFFNLYRYINHHFIKTPK